MRVNLSRQQALQNNKSRYTGKVCGAHPKLQGERYVRNGSCVGCLHERTAAHQRIRYRIDPSYRTRKTHWFQTPEGRAKIRTYQSKDTCRSRRRTRDRIRAGTEPTYALLRRMRARISNALCGKSKAARTLTLLGVPSIGFYKSYLEAQFQQGMTWDNRDAWHIDHILPVSSLDLSGIENQQIVFNYQNTRPMWKSQNAARGNRLVESDLDHIL